MGSCRPGKSEVVERQNNEVSRSNLGGEILRKGRGSFAKDLGCSLHPPVGLRAFQFRVGASMIHVEHPLPSRRSVTFDDIESKKASSSARLFVLKVQVGGMDIHVPAGLDHHSPYPSMFSASPPYPHLDAATEVSQR